MHLSTLSQKAIFNWPSWRSLLPLLTFFVSLGVSSSALAQAVVTANGSLAATTIIISANGVTTFYDANKVPKNNQFDGANLGGFDINTGQLVLRGGTATTTEPAGNTISSVTLYFLVRQGSNIPGFVSIPLTQTGVITNGDGTRTRTFELATAAQSLLASATTAGNYIVEVYLQARGSVTATGAVFNITDDNGGSDYNANFEVTGIPPITSVWTGGFNDNWFDARNWNNGIVPDSTSNAVIPNLPNGSTAQYPNIYSGVQKLATGQQTIRYPDGTFFIVPASPGYDNTNSGNAQVRDITLQANSPVDRSILRLIGGRLDVFGNFNNPIGSFIQRAGTYISFKSDGNQTISGSINGFVNVEIDGGANSIKTLTDNFVVRAGGSLRFIHGILQTNSARVSSNFVSFEAAITDDNTGTTIPAAQLIGETEVSFLRGYLTTTQVAAPGIPQDFSNIGMTLTFSGNPPGAVTVTRTNDTNNSPSSFGGSAPKPGIRRVFGVQPGNPSTNNGGLMAKIEFRYLTNELTGLRNSENTNDFSGSVDQNKLALYVSSLGGNTYSQLGRDSNDNNVLMKSGVTTFATFTLSEQQTPLPVELVAFDAKRTGLNVLVTWDTAMEISNSGFEVQVSNDGTNFHKIAFIPSLTVNSNSTLKYSYLDEQSGKSGIRYYRLRQLDTDGSQDFSPVRAIDFGNATGDLATTLAAYPNPYGPSDAVKLAVQTTSTGTAHLRVSDLIGRTITNQTFTTVNGVTEVAIDQAASLNVGSYLAQVTLPSGEVKTVRLQKR